MAGVWRPRRGLSPCPDTPVGTRPRSRASWNRHGAPRPLPDAPALRGAPRRRMSRGAGALRLPAAGDGDPALHLSRAERDDRSIGARVPWLGRRDRRGHPRPDGPHLAARLPGGAGGPPVGHARPLGVRRPGPPRGASGVSLKKRSVVVWVGWWLRLGLWRRRVGS